MIQVSAVLNDESVVNVPMQSMVFPGGEVHVSVETVRFAKEIVTTALLTDSQQVMQLLMVKDAINRLYPLLPKRLVMPYVPYARQDRVANPGEALGAKVFCQLVNQLDFSVVEVEDPHSDVVTALLDNVVVKDPLPSLTRLQQRLGAVALVAPDAGASKRVFKLAKGLGVPMLQAEKVRDTQTGQITGSRMQGELPNLPLLLVDDICDGGKTFTALAHEIRRDMQVKGYQQPLYLFVTHGIFSKGLDELCHYFDGVFARHSWISDPRCQLV
ncbi:ribose-phosphate pyrophosphokinase-like domain-containing protein [Leeia sp. TBRC 13508]|uniref:Ribose-phosphate pyrophosphokinase-like domain-containing protein n=1 Tax=Leeia speluncae TaxID=2884804 RepID=A0ABS8D4Q2_9NEIS|nr:ribose-phosphate pyrophosphokinase-like domain-containing protein [Leeia speluncae]MCB6182951.1 ribose-phosphate pyrophosphokinase-like domain-containing protein [Leeia speluncae]